MKKLFLCFSIIACIIYIESAFAVSAEGTLNLHVSSAAAEMGENVTITVSAYNVSNIGGIIFNLNYDDSKLSYLSSAVGKDMTMSTADVQHIASAHQIRLTALDDNIAWSTSGIILTVTFKVISQTNGQIPVTIDADSVDIVTMDFQPVTPSLTSGTIFVGAVRGDINGDGEVKITDARIALQSAVGKIKLSDSQIQIGDVINDGKINISDARMILQYAVGKINSL